MIYNKTSKFLPFSFFLLTTTLPAVAQITSPNGNFDLTGRLRDIQNDVRPVQVAVPFLTITPNARAAAMGDQGVATAPDENSAYWNPAKLSRVEKDWGFSLSYNPWLRQLVNDMSLSHLAFYYKLRKVDAIGVNLTYFDLGTVNFTDNFGNAITDFNPRELSIAATYSRQLSKRLSAGVTVKYINSNLSGNISNSAESQVKPGQTAAADLGFYYSLPLFVLERDMNLAFGAMISNIGGKISYSNNDRQDFIPTTMRLGSVMTAELDDFNKISVGIEASKLMVPSSQLEYQYVVNTLTGTPEVSNVYLVTPRKALLPGMFGSFSDAPYGAKEELQEIMLSFCTEYWYDNMFAVRGGYFYENPLKGNRQYFSVGFGIKYQIFNLDFAYLIPTTRNNPLANTLRFTLSFNFMKASSDKEKETGLE